METYDLNDNQPSVHSCQCILTYTQQKGDGYFNLAKVISVAAE